MKSTQTASKKFSKINLLVFFIFSFTTIVAQTFDDLPPEFGIDDDPEPGAPIDFYIPIIIFILFLTMWGYFYKTNKSTSKK